MYSHTYTPRHREPVLAAKLTVKSRKRRETYLVGFSVICGIIVLIAAVQSPPPSVLHPQGTFGPIFLGDVSSQWESHGGSSRGARRFIGCIRELRVNSKEIYLVAEGVRGRNIKNCDPPVCQHLPCQNGGTCVRYLVTFQIKESISELPFNLEVIQFNNSSPLKHFFF